MLRRVNSFSRTIGKQRQQFHFELSHIEIESGTPSSRSAPSLVIQIGRGDKTTTSKEVEAPQSEGAGLSFDDQKLSFRATLFSSKSGNATDYSEKLFKIAVLAVKPDFGTTKTVFKELAAAELDVAEYALSTEPFKVTLNCRGDRRNKIVVQFFICAWPVTAGDDDDDDDASEPAAGSGASGLTPTTAKLRPEPDVHGVGGEIPTPVRANFQRTKRVPEAMAPAEGVSEGSSRAPEKTREEPRGPATEARAVTNSITERIAELEGQLLSTRTKAAENEKFLNALVRTKEQEVAKVSRERDEARARLAVLEEEFKLLEEKVSSARGEARARLAELEKLTRERDEFRTQLGLAEELKAAAKLEELNQMMLSINRQNETDAHFASLNSAARASARTAGSHGGDASTSWKPPNALGAGGSRAAALELCSSAAELPPMVPLAELMVSEESHTKRRGAAPPPNNVYENLPGARGQASTARADDAGNRSARAMVTHEDAQGEEESEDEADEDEPPSANGADQVAERESEQDADEAQPPSADEPSDDGGAVMGGKAAWNPRYIGNWVQESIEADKLDAILKIQGYNYPTRKIVTSVKLSMTFTRDSDGDLFLVMKDPTGSNRLKCIDGAKLVIKNMGATLINTAQWEAGNLVVNLETHKGKTVTTAKITQRYDPATDKIYSENDSIEGFYVRTFKRSKKGPQAGDVNDHE